MSVESEALRRALMDAERECAVLDTALSKIANYPFDVNADAAEDLAAVKEIARVTLQRTREPQASG